MRFTIIVKGNQFADQYTRVSEKYSKWNFDLEEYGNMSNIEFVCGLSENDIYPRIVKRTKQYYAIVNPHEPTPTWLTDLEILAKSNKVAMDVRIARLEANGWEYDPEYRIHCRDNTFVQVVALKKGNLYRVIKQYSIGPVTSVKGRLI